MLTFYEKCDLFDIAQDCFSTPGAVDEAVKTAETLYPDIDWDDEHREFLKYEVTRLSTLCQGVQRVCYQMRSDLPPFRK